MPWQVVQGVNKDRTCTLPCFGWRWHWQHGQFFEICVINKGGLYPTRGMLRICVHPARESVHVQEMAGFYPRNTLPEANISGSSTYWLQAGCWPRSRGYRLLASSLSARPLQQSYSKVDCDQGGERPKTRSLRPSRQASASPCPQIIGNVRWVFSRCELLHCTTR